MLVFNNQQRTGYEEIVSYAPHFYPQIKEMDAIYRFAGWTCDLMATDLEKLVAMQFIKYMDDELLARYESFIGIDRDYSKTLEERKTISLAKSNSSGKISKSKIQSIVNSFVECDCRVSLDDSDIVVDMMFRDNPAKYMNYIREILQKEIPAHMKILYRGVLDISIIFEWKNHVSIPNIKMSYGTQIIEHFSNVIKSKINFSTKNDIEISLITKKNAYYLDGTILLDGSRKLNAYVKQEDL